jgi:hypothetical protein
MSHHKPNLRDAFVTRRDFLCKCGVGMGALSLAALFGETSILLPSAQAAESINPLLPKSPHFPGKAKRVVHFFLNGGPSHVDSFDPKPALEKYKGQPLPGEYIKTERKTGAAFPSPFKFRKCGQSGLEISDLFPQIGALADDLCLGSFDEGRASESRAIPHADELRRCRAKPSEPWLVDDLRLGNGEREFAGVHRAVSRGISDQGRGQLAERFPARRSPGHVY